MPPSNTRSDHSFQSTLSKNKPSVAFVAMIFGALIAFEIFNYSTTDHALGDLLGNLTFAGIQWSTILALAFCGIDFAGIARLFTPEQGADEPKEVWYLFGAWLLAATMNAILTWWGVSIAVVNQYNQSSSSAVIDPETLSSVVPVFVAIMVWVIRILIIGTLSLALDRLAHPGAPQHTMLENAFEASTHRHAAAETQPQQSSFPTTLSSASVQSRPASRTMPSSRPAPAARPAPRTTGPVTPAPRIAQPEYEEEEELPVRQRMEPSYHSLSAQSRGGQTSGSRYRRS